MKLLAKWACTLFVAGLGTASCSAASEVRAVYMSLDSGGARVRKTFYTDTTSISCVIDWVGNSADTTIDAVIKQTYKEDPNNPGSIMAFAGAIMAAGEQAGTEGEATYAFTWTMQSPNGGGVAPYPIGKYECDISVNGEAAGTTGFDIEYPTPDSNKHMCPAEGAATPGAACAGWVVQGATCPSAADMSQTCVCGGATWSCQ
ncbi:MAG TPA: hypothetical protein VLM85_17940 [Polyangiaceae bacterium]|nr:hypothetical protein [Polyangiaceae bacterium]